MDLNINDYKIYHYLNNLWSNKFIQQVSVPLTYSNDKLQLSSNCLIKKYECLLELFNSEIQYEDFIKIFKNNLILIKNISYSKNYFTCFDIRNFNLKSEGDLKNNLNVVIETITDEDIKLIYTYLHSSIDKKKNIIKKYSKCIIIPKNKNQNNITEPNNFRYFINHHNVIKIIDRLWCIKLLSKFKYEPLNKNIFKSSLLKNDFSHIIKLASLNTTSQENKVILDVEKAFDSIDWDIMHRLIRSNLSKKINKNDSEELIEEYMLLLKNRLVYYDNFIINVSSGIPLGLPSSNIVFHFMIDEIISRWLENNKKYYSNFILNIFVDDIYLEFDKFITINEINYLITNFINYFKNYGLKINRNKIKFGSNIYTKKIGNLLLETDLYLGIPFTRNIEKYGEITLNQFNERYYTNLTWSNIYEYISTKTNCSNSLTSYFCFKLKPIIGIYVNKKILLEFIKTHYLLFYM
jgi:hypothetical protein